MTVENERVDPTEETYYTTEQVGKIFQVSADTIREWLNNGKLNGVHVGQQWRVTRSELVRYANQEHGA